MNDSRPPILTKEGMISEFVKGVIRDRDGNLVGIILVEQNKSIIQFLGKASVVITFNKLTKELEFNHEVFPKDPKPFLDRLLKKDRFSRRRQL